MDRDLVEAAQGGDREAFVDLVHARSDRLFGLAQRILRDVDRAEDALQDALVIAWRDLRGLRDPDRFDAWLQRLVINVCIGQATRERRRTANLRVLPIEGPAAPDDSALRRRPGPARTRVPSARARSAGDARSPPLPRVRTLGDRRDSRHPARDGPIPTTSRPPRDASSSRGRRPRRGHRRSFGMTHQRDIDRLLDHWLSEGSTQSPDRVVDAVAERIERVPQQPAWRLRWKERPVNSYLKPLAAIAAVVLVAVIGFGLLSANNKGVGGPSASPTSSPAQPTAAASAFACDGEHDRLRRPDRRGRPCVGEFHRPADLSHAGWLGERPGHESHVRVEHECRPGVTDRGAGDERHRRSDGVVRSHQEVRRGLDGAGLRRLPPRPSRPRH